MLALKFDKTLEGTQGVMRHAPRRSGQQQRIGDSPAVGGLALSLFCVDLVLIVIVSPTLKAYRRGPASVRELLPAGVRVHFLVSFD